MVRILLWSGRWVSGRKYVLLGQLTSWGIVIAALWWLGLGEALAELGKVSLGYFSLAAGIFLTALFVRFVKWFVILRREYGGEEIARMFVRTKVLEGILPAKLGSFTRLAFARFRTSTMGFFIVFDKSVEACVLIPLGVGGLVGTAFLDKAFLLISGFAMLFPPWC